MADPISRKSAAAPAPKAGGESRGRGRPGGEDSRTRIIEEAGELFAQNGFDAVSVRRIARRAGVNVAAIAYHFGGKQGLYEAVVRQIIIDTRPLVAPVAERTRAGVAAAQGDRAALAKLAARFVRHILAALLASERLRWQHALLVREFGQPSGVFPIIMRDAVDPMHDAVGALVAAATGVAPDGREARLLTTCVVGQCMVYGIARQLVCARMGWADYTPDTIEDLIALVTGTVQRTIGLPETGPASEGAE